VMRAARLAALDKQNVPCTTPCTSNTPCTTTSTSNTPCSTTSNTPCSTTSNSPCSTTTTSSVGTHVPRTDDIGDVPSQQAAKKSSSTIEVGGENRPAGGTQARNAPLASTHAKSPAAKGGGLRQRLLAAKNSRRFWPSGESDK
jgi:hypothetical protein